MKTDKKVHNLESLLNIYDMFNLEFKVYSNKDNGQLELYLKTDIDEISVFKSIDKFTKTEYLNLSEKEAKNIKFILDRKVKEMELDIVCIVLKTSDVNIPCAKYTLKTLDELVKEQDKEERNVQDGESDGIVYTIVDNNTGCNLYDNVYLFNKEKDGLISELAQEYEYEKNELIKNNLKIILDYYNDLSEEKSFDK